MRYLLDTQVVIWLVQAPERLSGAMNEVVDDPRATVLLSSVCLWEAAIKQGLGKLRVPDDLPQRLAAWAFVPLAVTHEHAWAVRRLAPIHRDPFDRALIAQAQVERATLVTADARLDAYDVTTLR